MMAPARSRLTSFRPQERDKEGIRTSSELTRSGATIYRRGRVRGTGEKPGKQCPGHAGRARSGAGHATSGIAAFPGLRVSACNKKGTDGFAETRATQPRQRKTKIRKLEN